MPGIDLSTVPNSPEKNCCACGKRMSGAPTANLLAEDEASTMLSDGQLVYDMETMSTDMNSSSQFWMISILAILAMATLMYLYRRRATVKFNSDDFIRAELIETGNKSDAEGASNKILE